jgi:hypothetical protein
MTRNEHNASYKATITALCATYKTVMKAASDMKPFERNGTMYRYHGCRWLIKTAKNPLRAINTN